MSTTHRYFASTAPDLAPLLDRELKGLGAFNVRKGGAGVYFEGTQEVAYRACLWSRIANRILLPVTAFTALDGDMLYEEMSQIRWERHLHSSGTLAVDCSTSRATLGHSQFAALKAKDAVVDRFRDKFGERPFVDTEFPDLRINLHLRGDQARVAIDLSGSSLHRRGYRVEGGSAPLKENLAAGLLLSAGWDKLAASGAPLVDPMCGSGTLLIEAALIAGDIAPGLLRDYFGFLGWRGHDPELWESLIAEARQRRETGMEKVPPIFGFDRDSAAIQIAEENIINAGLQERIQVEQRALNAFTTPAVERSGLLIVNPPYGERLGDKDSLATTYAELGRKLQSQLPGWQAAIFTSNPELAQMVALPPAGKPTGFKNGPIDCQLLRYRIPKTGGSGETAADLDALSEGARMFANRVKKNLKRLGKWARKEGIDCYRIYDADLPEYALAVDLYQGEGGRWLHVQEYAPPAKVDQDAAWQRLQEALAALPAVMELPREAIFFKVRQRQKGSQQYQRQGSRGAYFEVRELGARLLVNLSDYLDTGLFLDHRPIRRMIQHHIAGKSFLNLFAYTGVATVEAAVGGAEDTTTVDLSPTYLEWAQRNLTLNGYTDREHRIIQEDVVYWLRKESRRGSRLYDVIFLDPPTVSKSKRMEGDFDVQRDHVQMINNALALLKDGGVLIFSTNFRRFKFDEEALAETPFREISPQTIPPDFERRPNIHRCWLLVKTERDKKVLDSFTKI